ncbi:recombinase [Testudinibacter sp. TR-2022]|uniref:phosphoribosyltransferase n=1 Tax=Testudinibacter sp. TR-2022 TaxID=2585029 RepID=UPI00111A3979|nr:recombinase [Testudinibacter sp. TR-2022]TNH02565.1 recombinase [Pasteurellaceae bacterium Phil31]TNH08373.1 recombinase [Testudinibacter sp. TR-2022]TNH09158.1 recombinase [Testudinibacter sp. TR-2022]TNH12854.1 recombinase [Testudinibacter sp. TR-2022]TNH18062.1 recombinase [Testudinibacter sp. TR-2022]
MRTEWNDNFPDTLIDRRLGDATSHPEYIAAKSGDVTAAYRLAKDLVTDEAVQKLKLIIGQQDFVIVPVHAEEAIGINMIPLAVAKVLAEKLGKAVDLSIVQATKVSRTGSDGWHRLANSPKFDGVFPAHQNALILDDTQTQGGTLASLKGYIERQGGKVIAVYALTGKQYSVQLKLSTTTLTQLRGKYGDLEAWWTREFGYGFDKLTEWEAKFLINSGKTIDQVRDFIIKAKQN